MTAVQTGDAAVPRFPHWRQRSDSWREANLYQVKDDRLLIDNDEDIALDRVDEVRFSFAPGPLGHTGFAVQIVRANAPSITFTSLRWHLLVQFSRDDPRYRAFTLALAAAVSRSAPHARFFAGKSMSAWLADVATLTLIFCVFAVAAFQSLEYGWDWLCAAGLALAPPSVVPFMRGAMRNFPRPLPRGHVPAGLVPSDGAD